MVAFRRLASPVEDEQNGANVENDHMRVERVRVGVEPGLKDIVRQPADNVGID